MKKVLVLGGNQFLGIDVCKTLLSKYKVFVLNRGSRKNVEGVIHLKANRDDKTEMKEVIKDLKFDFIVDISAYNRNQIEISLNLLKEKYKKYILISSASVYNKIKDTPFLEDDNAGANPIWGDYSKEKYLCEEALKKEKKNFVIIRPFYIYGPGNNLDRENYFFNRILNDQKIYIPSKKVKIQFGYVTDLSNFIVEIFNNFKLYNGIYNFSGNEVFTFEEIVKIFEKVLNKKANIEYIDTYKEKIKSRQWFPFRETNLYGDISKLLSVNNFNNSVDFFKGVEKTYNYVKENNLLNDYQLSSLEKKWSGENL